MHSFQGKGRHGQHAQIFKLRQHKVSTEGNNQAQGINSIVSDMHHKMYGIHPRKPFNSRLSQVNEVRLINHYTHKMNNDQWPSSKKQVRNKQKQNEPNIHRYKNMHRHSDIVQLYDREGNERVNHNRVFVKSKVDGCQKQNCSEVEFYGKKKSDQRIISKMQNQNTIAKSKTSLNQSNSSKSSKGGKEYRQQKIQKLLKNYPVQCRNHLMEHQKRYKRYNNISSPTYQQQQARNKYYQNQSYMTKNWKKKCPTYQRQLEKFMEGYGKQMNLRQKISQTERYCYANIGNSLKTVIGKTSEIRDTNNFDEQLQTHKQNQIVFMNQKEENYEPTYENKRGKRTNLSYSNNSYKSKTPMGLKGLKEYQWGVTSQKNNYNGNKQERVSPSRRNQLENNPSDSRKKSGEISTFSHGKSITFQTTHQTIKGSKKKVNQDSIKITPDPQLSTGSFPIWIVCDGHGQNGHQVSWYTSNLIHQLTFQTMQKNNGKISKKQIQQIFIQTKQSLQQTAIDLTLSGSTCVMVVVVPTQNGRNKLICASLGDSTAMVVYEDNSKKGIRRTQKVKQDKYQKNMVIQEQDDECSEESQDEGLNLQVGNFRQQNIGSQRYQVVSREHKPGNKDEKQRICFYGGSVHKNPNKQKFSESPMRLWGSGNDSWGPGLAVSRSFGDKMAQQYGLISEPEITEINITNKIKYIVLGSDGIFDQIRPSEMANLLLLENTDKIVEKCEMLCQISHRRWQGCADDISVIIAALQYK